MVKEKVNFIYRIKHYFTYHPHLKIIALLLAIIVWLYVKGEISRFNY
ncbi:MAG: hypothetical protein PHG40_02825 [Candidatus Omnitrophica bacterium]|nr:hypothetical protein [Candidatus Omnitrophota bacterium]